MASVRKVNWTHKGVTKAAWQVVYTDPATGKRPAKNFKMKKEADAYRLKVEREIEDGIHTAGARSRTVAEVCEAYIAHAEDKRKDGRIGDARLYHIRLFLTRDVMPHIGKVLISELTVDVVDELYAKVLKEGRLSSHILRARFIILKQVEDFAFRKEWTKKSAVPIALKELRGMAQPEQKKFTTDQVLSLLSAAKVRRPKVTERSRLMLECMVNLAAFCGLRYGEIVGLKPENIAFEEGVIRVRHSVTNWNELKGPKTRAGIRDVPMPDNVANLVRRFMDDYSVQNALELVFVIKSGVPLKNGAFHVQKWQPLLASVGLRVEAEEQDSHHFHALRGFAASWWIDNGVPVTTVAKWLGHSKADMTLEFYARSLVSSVDQREVADRLAARLLARSGGLFPATTARQIELNP